MAETKGKVTVTKYIPITGSPYDDERYENALFSGMQMLVSQLGYDLVMRTETNAVKGEAWIELTAKKKDDPR